MKMKIKIVAVIIVLIACGGLLVWAERPQGDLDGDGTVNNHDLTILANDWLTTGEDTPAHFASACSAGKYIEIGRAHV